MNGFEVLAVLGSLILGIVCLKSRKQIIAPTILFWSGVTFIFIGFTRALYLFGLMDIYSTRLVIGIFYSMVLVGIFLDTKGIFKKKDI